MANLIQKAIQAFQGRKNYTPPLTPGIKFFSFGNQTNWTDLTTENIEKYLLNCAPLAAIINRKATAFLTGKQEIVNPNTGNYVRGVYKEWEKLLKQPNPLQTDRQFRQQLYTYIQAYGYCPVLIMQPAGFKDFSRVSQMWILPPNYLTIQTNEKYTGATSINDQIDRITFSNGGYSEVIDKDSVYIFTDVNTTLDNLIFPDSRLVPLKYPIQNLITNYESRGEIMDNQGARGILSSEPKDLSQLPFTPEEQEALQSDWLQYGLKARQRKLIITNAALKWQPMSMNIADLMLLEMAKADVETICDGLGYPFELMSNEKGTTFNNLDSAEKRLYQDTIIPESLNYYDHLNKALHSEQNNILIQSDYSHLPVFQADEKLKAEVNKITGDALIQQFNNNVITYNEMRKGLYLDTVPGMDLYYYQLKTTFDGNNTSTTES